MLPERLEPGFVREGRFFALPLAVPGECDPIDPDESYLTTLTLAGDGTSVYAASSGGRACHVVQAALLGPVGMVLDLGVIPEALEVRFLVAQADSEWGDSIYVGVRHAGGSQMWHGHTRHLHDTVQEPHFLYPEFTLVSDFTDIIMFDGIQEPDGSILMLCDAGLARWNQTDGVAWITKDPELFSGAVPRLLRLNPDTVVWIAANGAISTVTGEPFAQLPQTLDAGATACVDRSSSAEHLIVFNADGMAWRVGRNAINPLGKTVLAPVRAAAVIADGRIFVCCGDGIAHWDCFEPTNHRWRDLGAVVATLPQPRYGLSFAAIMPGPHGEVWLAENDRGGSLWLYHPAYPTPVRIS